MDSQRKGVNSPTGGNAAAAAAPSSASTAGSSSSPPSPQRSSRRSVTISSAAPNHPTPSTATSTAPPRVVPRPPLNIYLRVAIVRNENDALICEDPEHPGKKKRVVIGSLLDERKKKKTDDNKQKEGEKQDGEKVESSNDTLLEGGKKSSSTFEATPLAMKKRARHDVSSNSSKSQNKKEIPVPTITTVSRYDTDVPPTYSIPPSYVRHVCPSYREVMNDTVEYNVDGEDETWWRNNNEFGPYSKAKILWGDDKEKEEGKDDLDSEQKQQQQGVGVVGSRKETQKSKQRARSNKGKFVKKNASVEESASREDASMDVDTSPTSTADNAKLASSNLDTDTATTQQQPSKKNLTIHEVILLNPLYLHSPYSTSHLLQKYQPKLPLNLLEQMMDLLEKATGFDSIITKNQAEELLARRLPNLEELFGPLSLKERRRMEMEEERKMKRWLQSTGTTNNISINDDDGGGDKDNDGGDKPTLLPTIAPPPTLQSVIHSVYNHWMTKRSRLRKPLLRRYWPPTSATDTNPHQVFRQREKEKRRLRKKRQNDVEAYNKLRGVREDFERLRVLTELILRREEVQDMGLECCREFFEERLAGFLNSSDGDGDGVDAKRTRLSKESIENVLLNVPKYFDDGPIVKTTRGGKKRKRVVGAGGRNAADSRDPSPVPHHHHHHSHHHAGSSAHHSIPGMAHPSHISTSGTLTHPSHQQHLGGGMKHPSHPHHPLAPMSHHPHPPPPTIVPPKNIIVAGHDGGFPAPNFLQPLASRDSHPVTTAWDEQCDVPLVLPGYVNGQLTTATSTSASAAAARGNAYGGNTFRHRPRLGRGGRIIVDRIPNPSSLQSNHLLGAAAPSPTVITYGSPLKKHGYDLYPLGADGPCYSINSSPDKLCNPNNEVGTGTDAKSAPKALPAQRLEDLFPKDLGDREVLSRKIEEICALGLMEDLSRAQSISGSGGAASAVLAKGGNNTSTSAAGVGGGVTHGLAEEMDEVLVPIEDWMEAPDAMKIYGSEKFVIGPL